MFAQDLWPSDGDKPVRAAEPGVFATRGRGAHDLVSWVRNRLLPAHDGVGEISRQPRDARRWRSESVFRYRNVAQHLDGFFIARIGMRLEQGARFLRVFVQAMKPLCVRFGQ